MSEDDDWFESALSEDETDDADSPGNDEGTDSTEDPWGEQEADATADSFDDEDEDATEDPWGDGDTGSTESPWDNGDTESATTEDQAFDSGGFGEEMADGEVGGSEDAERTFGDDSGEFGASEGESGPLGGGGEESLFDDEGFGGLGGDDAEFEEEDFESEIPRIDLGIEGLDNMIQGGVPERHRMVTIGSAGTGKTTFGLQFLHHGLVNGENAVFITLEQSHEAIIATANEFGWDFAGFEQEDRLAVVDLDPVEMANSLDNIQAELPRLIRDFDADRLVLDSVSLLEMMYDNQAKRRTEVFDFTRSLKKAGVTTFLTSEASESNAYASRHGIIEYLTDAVFVLDYVRGETQETRLAVEIQKIRNANHSREKKPYEMSEGGLSVYQQANIF
jgi:KaiC domain protein